MATKKTTKTKKTLMLGADVKVSPINKTLKDRSKKEAAAIKKADAAAKKRGSVRGEAQ